MEELKTTVRWECICARHKVSVDTVPLDPLVGQASLGPCCWWGNRGRGRKVWWLPKAPQLKSSRAGWKLGSSENRAIFIHYTASQKHRLKYFISKGTHLANFATDFFLLLLLWLKTFPMRSSLQPWLTYWWDPSQSPFTLPSHHDEIHRTPLYSSPNPCPSYRPNILSWTL